MSEHAKALRELADNTGELTKAYATILAAADELERLEAIVAKLPRDKEGNLFKRYGVIGEPELETPFELTET